MRGVVQRVQRAQVTVAGEVVGKIGAGVLVLVGAAEGDTPEDADQLASKVATLRLFEDVEGKTNLDLAAVGGAVLAVSQFTLLGDCRKGRRPSFIQAARPEVAEPLFDRFCAQVRAAGLTCETGRFRTHMAVELLNDGPVTLLLDTRKAF
jgi:D-tyrosyl-tRNA(Tyr) deacylase